MQSQASQPAEDSRGKKKNRNKKKKGAAAEVRHVSGNEITGSPEAEEQNGSPQASTPVVRRIVEMLIKERGRRSY